MDKDDQAGLTLIEMLIVISILGISLSVAYSGMQHLVQYNQANEATARIVTAFQLARNLALHQQKVITLCGSTNSLACDGQWSDQIILFVDQDANGQPDDIISHHWPAIKHGNTLWRAFRGSQILQVNPNGLPRGYNGTFIYCPHNGNRKYSRGLVINKGGRVRALIDSNNDGIVNTSPTRNLECE